LKIGAILQTIISAFAGLASYFLTVGFTIPSGLEFFKYLAVLGAMSGYGLGGLSVTKSVSISKRAVMIIAALFLGASATILYWISVELVRAGPWLAVALAALLVVAFASLGFIVCQIANMPAFQGDRSKAENGGGTAEPANGS
jgi:hypothetical protein